MNIGFNICLVSSQFDSEMTAEALLYPCEPQYWMFLTTFQRKVLGWILVELFILSFFGVPIALVLSIPIVWKSVPYLATAYLAAMMISMMLPRKEWLLARKLFQLWYELFNFSSNLSPEDHNRILEASKTDQIIVAMHPHGIIPLHGAMWASYCDQYLHDPESGRSVYGFTGMASIVQYLPFVRNILGWLCGVPADYAVLKRGLMKGHTKPYIKTLNDRKPKNLTILPGGIAEVFVSTPGKHAIVFKSRKGLCKLSIETGAKLVPCYVFGANDFFVNVPKYGGAFAYLSRYLRVGITFFWGQFGLAIPFTPKVSMVFSEPINPPSGWSGVGPIPAELVSELHSTYMKAIVELFDKYKAVCGCPEATLEIL